MNLQELLARLNDLDSAGEGEISPEEFETISINTVDELHNKVDAIQKVLSRLDFEEDRLKEEANKFAQASKRVAANAKRLEAWVISSMRAFEFKQLPGHKYQARLRSSKSLEVDREPTPEDYLVMPQFVRRTVETQYIWIKDDIKKAIADGSDFQYGHIVEKYRVEFPIKKGQTNDNPTGNDIDNSVSASGE